MIKALILALVPGGWAEMGMMISNETYQTKEECYAHYDNIENWELQKIQKNFYSSNTDIHLFNTPFGAVWVACKEIKNG